MSNTGRKKNSQSGELFKFAAVGDTLKGYFLGSQQAIGEYGPCVKHVFKTAKGIKTVFGSKGLNDLLEGENPGTLVEIVYTHDQASKKKNRAAMKMFDSTWYDAETLDASEVNSSVDAATSEEEDSYDDEPVEVADDEILADEVKTSAVRTAPKASTPSSEQQRKVRDLLAKRRAG